MENFTMSAYDEQCLKNKSLYSYSVCPSCDVELYMIYMNQRIVAWNPQYEIIENW